MVNRLGEIITKPIVTYPLMVFIELVYLYLVPYLHFMSVHGSGLDRDAMLKCYYISDSIFKPCTGAVLVLLCTCFGFTDEYIWIDNPVQ